VNGSGKVLLAKTSLDGHWRGLTVVSRALRDAGFEVVMIGMARPEEIVAAALDEDVDLVGLNVGGRVEVVERAIIALREALDVEIFVGGTLAPYAVKRVAELGVEVYPPGTPLATIVDAAHRLVALDRHCYPA
jgi:methylmalonyl-CoA mutase C-terminal domain/subunit